MLGQKLKSRFNGKNENFERPVIVMKVYNKETLLVLPITSKQKDDAFHHKITTDQKIVWVKLTHRELSAIKGFYARLMF
jgi:hypothetical protein